MIRSTSRSRARTQRSRSAAPSPAFWAPGSCCRTTAATTCVVAMGSGIVTNANITTVAITCTTNRYLIGGSVSGLAGSGLVLRDNGGDDLPVTANGTFVFATSVPSGQTYNVTVRTQP